MSQDAPQPHTFSGSFTPTLPELPYDAWVETKRTLHLVCQIVGKLRLAMVPRRNHWWHVPLHVTPRGLTTGTMFAPNDPLLTLDIEIDLVEPGVLHLRTSRGFEEVLTLPYDGSACSRVYGEIVASLSRAGVDAEILPKPYELPWTEEPFPKDDRQRAFADDTAARFFRAISWIDRVFNEFRGEFLGKSTPSHFFWHSFDLAVTRFSGRENPQPPSEFRNPRDAEAYSHEVFSVGFWPGDDDYRKAAFYAYAAPQPDGLEEEPLQPAAAHWRDVGGSHMATLDWDNLRKEADPREALLSFLRSAYDATAKRGDWPDLMLPPMSHYDPRID